MSASKWLVQRILYRFERRLPVHTKTPRLRHEQSRQFCQPRRIRTSGGRRK
ncbi:hypothetical protein ABZY10_33365 [Streptomyces sp. NPDC006539]|uniref:hypothetical protein n=1 Tax=unclassified Streptomyces TaxID=2593676 RepID=UPI0033B6AC7A